MWTLKQKLKRRQSGVRGMYTLYKTTEEMKIFRSYSRHSIEDIRYRKQLSSFYRKTKTWATIKETSGWIQS